jgi:hypothetical protein
VTQPLRRTARRPSGLRSRLAAGLLGLAWLAGVPGCGGDGASAERFCEEVGRVPVVSSADQLRGPGGQATLSELREALDRLRAAAPGDVRDDVTTLGEVTGQLQEALRRQDEGDEAAKDRARRQLDDGLAAFEEASKRIVGYTRRTCGVDLTGTVSSTTAVTAGVTTGPPSSTTAG